MKIINGYVNCCDFNNNLIKIATLRAVDLTDSFFIDFAARPSLNLWTGLDELARHDKLHIIIQFPLSAAFRQAHPEKCSVFRRWTNTSRPFLTYSQWKR
jgi:hypothetical protein